MAITGIGVDIEEISRFKNLPYVDNQTFYKKIFTEDEIKYCLSKSNPAQHFAARFCAKEACMKALQEEVKDYTKIEVFFDGEKPVVKWKNKIVHLSLSHEQDKAIAFVIVESED